MSEIIKLKGLLIDVYNLEVKTVEIDYHKGNGYSDFEEIIGSSWISSCKRPAPFMDDVLIVHDDNGLYKKPLRPGYILHKNGDFLSIIAGNIFILEEKINEYGEDEFASLTESEIRILTDYIVEIEKDGEKMIALVINADEPGMIHQF